MVNFGRLDRTITDAFSDVVQAFGQTLPQGISLERTNPRTMTVNLTPEQLLAHEGYTTVEGEIVSPDRWSERLIEDFDFELQFAEAMNGASL
jgi:hypothetical protein